MDERLRELERRSAKAPHDPAVAVAFGLALARAGDRARAATELSRAVDLEPGNHDALVALDEVTRGGGDPLAPWAGGRGDARRSNRSPVPGPVRGATTAQLFVRESVDIDALSVEPGGTIVVGSEGPPQRLVRIAPDGSVVVLREAPDCGALLTAGGPVERRLTGRVAREVNGKLVELEVGFLWLSAPGHVISAPSDRPWRVEAWAWSRPEAPRFTVPLASPPASLAIAPGAELVILSHGSSDTPVTLTRVSLATGHVRSELTFPDARGYARRLVVASSGTIHVGLGATLAAVLPGNAVAWRRPLRANPVALAGASEDVLIVAVDREKERLALDARTGETLWRLPRRSGYSVRPKVDRDGRVYAEIGDELVALEPRTGERLATWRVGDAGFAPLAPGLMVAARRQGTGVELSLLE